MVSFAGAQGKRNSSSDDLQGAVAENLPERKEDGQARGDTAILAEQRRALSVEKQN